ncbi:MAG: flavodoxin family protein [Candidatus Omnitrophota bacterium]
MKILVINGSPRGKRGNTYIMAEAFLQGAGEVGATVEQILLSKKTIKNCKGCFWCWLKTPGKCVIKDDMDPILEKLKEADLLVFATPLYVDNVTGLMKNFMDRILPLGEPYQVKDEKGECRHPARYVKTPKIGVISNCGFPEQSQFQVLHLLFSRIARNLHSEVALEIYRGEGELLKQTTPEIKAVVDKYKDVLRIAGREAAQFSKLSQKTIDKLNEPLVPFEEYITTANNFFSGRLDKK